MKTQLTYLLALLACAGQAAAQQQCHDRINHTTPTYQFATEEDGTTFHARTGLAWQRCPLGFVLNDGQTPEHYSDDRCEPNGQERFTWQEAFAAATDLNNTGGIGGEVGWRLPNLKELMSIVERKCYQPALNSRVFPLLEKFEYWSSTVYWYTNDAATVDFASGFNRRSRKDEPNDRLHVRLVRDVPRP